MWTTLSSLCCNFPEPNGGHPLGGTHTPLKGCVGCAAPLTGWLPRPAEIGRRDFFFFLHRPSFSQHPPGVRPDVC
jgi:hypothetical protein